jgi:endonuclease YncB( thermonuclease family)
MLGGCDAGVTADDGSSRSRPPSRTSSPAEQSPASRQAAVVVSIADGDTVRLRGVGPGPLPDGETVRVRLLEVDSPETEVCGYAEATATLTGLLPRGATVRVARDRDLQDRFDRYLLYLWTEDGRFVNEAMVARGYARAVLFRPNDAYIDRLRAAEDAARASRRGLWASCGSAG